MINVKVTATTYTALITAYGRTGKARDLNLPQIIAVIQLDNGKVKISIGSL